MDKTLKIILGVVLVVIGLPILGGLLMGILHMTFGILILAIPFIGIYLIYSAMQGKRRR